MRYALIVGLILLLVAGCSDYPTDEQFNDATKWCDEFGGLKKTSFKANFGLMAWCMDGKIVSKHLSN